jgi:hypothetical protein
VAFDMSVNKSTKTPLRIHHINQCAEKVFLSSEELPSPALASLTRHHHHHIYIP